MSINCLGEDSCKAATTAWQHGGWQQLPCPTCRLIGPSSCTMAKVLPASCIRPALPALLLLEVKACSSGKPSSSDTQQQRRCSRCSSPVPADAPAGSSQLCCPHSTAAGRVLALPPLVLLRLPPYPALMTIAARPRTACRCISSLQPLPSPGLPSTVAVNSHSTGAATRRRCLCSSSGPAWRAHKATCLGGCCPPLLLAAAPAAAPAAAAPPAAAEGGSMSRAMQK